LEKYKGNKTAEFAIREKLLAGDKPASRHAFHQMDQLVTYGNLKAAKALTEKHNAVGLTYTIREIKGLDALLKNPEKAIENMIATVAKECDKGVRWGHFYVVEELAGYRFTLNHYIRNNPQLKDAAETALTKLNSTIKKAEAHWYDGNATPLF
jgi:hypothetical protein